jgi:3-dehydroquinate synthase
MIINSSIKKYGIKFYKEFDIDLLNYKKGDVIIIDSNVSIGNTNLDVIEICCSEETKSYDYLPTVIQKIIDTSFSRENKLIAVGGGVTQDIVSFISSILFRGVDWVFLPTTLLSQGDSCIGGKTSINFRKYKNQLGNFNPPNEIIICESFLKTLSNKEILSGLGEMLHFYLVSGKEDFDFYKKYHKSDNLKIVRRCLEIKKGFVEKDEFDRGERLLLNYGHTFGHAIENITNYSYPHGISVCFGMDIANFISMKLGFINKDLYEELKDFIFSVHNINFDSVVNVSNFIDALKKDKKNNLTGHINCVLTRGVGDMFLKNISIDAMEKYLEEYGFNK